MHGLIKVPEHWNFLILTILPSNIPLRIKAQIKKVVLFLIESRRHVFGAQDLWKEDQDNGGGRLGGTPGAFARHAATRKSLRFSLLPIAPKIWSCCLLRTSSHPLVEETRCFLLSSRTMKYKATMRTLRRYQVWRKETRLPSAATLGMPWYWGSMIWMTAYQ